MSTIDKLEAHEFVPFAPSELGTVHVDHCKPGKPKLYITKKSDGVILGHCFHCGKSGVKYPAGKEFKSLSDYRQLGTTIQTDRVQDKVELPPYEPGWDSLPMEAKAWFLRYGISPEDVDTMGFGWSNELQRIILPVWHHVTLDDNAPTPTLTAFWQGRSLNPRPGVPKYINVRSSKHAGCFYIYKKGENEHEHYAFTNTQVKDIGTLVLCEDMLSALRLGKYLPTVALLGTDIPANLLTALHSSGAKRIIQFLDDDNSRVKLKQQRNLQTLRLVFGDDNVFCVRSGGLDPKDFSDEALKEILDDTLINKRK